MMNLNSQIALILNQIFKTISSVSLRTILPAHASINRINNSVLDKKWNRLELQTPETMKLSRRTRKLIGKKWAKRTMF